MNYSHSVLLVDVFILLVERRYQKPAHIQLLVEKNSLKSKNKVEKINRKVESTGMDDITRNEFWTRQRAKELSEGLKLSKAAVYRWRHNEIPVKRLVAVSELTGFPRERLRPDIFA